MQSLIPDQLSPGDVLTFRTSPFTAFAPPDTGRWAALRVLAVDERQVGVAVLDGVWSTPPSLEGALACDILRRRRFAFRDEAVLLGVGRNVWKSGDLPDLVRIGSTPLSDALIEAGAIIIGFRPGASHGSLDGASTDAEGEWRWTHDRDALRAEIDQETEAEEAAEAAREARLVDLTWETLLAEPLFPQWVEKPPADFTRHVRTLLQTARQDAFALGERPKKAAVRAILKTCVEALNAADAAFGLVVETVEREQLVESLYEIAVLCGQPGMGEDIDNWRNW